MLHKSIETETHFFRFPIRSTAVEFPQKSIPFHIYPRQTKLRTETPSKAMGRKHAFQQKEIF